jgi:hypothetical protein
MSDSVGQGEAGFQKPTNLISHCQTTLSAGNHKEYLRGNESGVRLGKYTSDTRRCGAMMFVVSDGLAAMLL